MTDSARKRFIHPKGAQDLVMGIVQQASNDLYNSRPCSTERQEVERFFRSEYFTTLTGLNGTDILKQFEKLQGGASK